MIAYILYSESLDRFYVGHTSLRVEERLAQHNNRQHLRAMTGRGIPWVEFYHFPCEDRLQARRIERHIKAMKSRKYYESLKKYPELLERLRNRYKTG